MPGEREDKGALLQGTLEMLVLKVLALEPMHAWGLAQRIERMSADVFPVPQGSLYPALVRMKRRGWLRTTWRITEHNRRARYYEITAEGRGRLEVEREEWSRMSAAIDLILNAKRVVEES